MMKQKRKAPSSLKRSKRLVLAVFINKSLCSFIAEGFVCLEMNFKVVIISEQVNKEPRKTQL